MGYSVELMSVQGVVFKNVFLSLKEILLETTAIFDKTGMKIEASNDDETMLVHLKLNADQIEKYVCKEKKIITFNMLYFSKIIGTITNNDVLTLYLDEKDESYLGIIIENSEDEKITEHKMNLRDGDNIGYNQIEEPDFPSVINIKLAKLQKICKDMTSLLMNRIEITNTGNELIFSGKGGYSQQRTIFREKHNTNEELINMDDESNCIKFIEKSDNDEIIQGFFLLKHFYTFTKCSGLCTHVKMYLRNNFPIIIAYDVGNMGELKLCLVPSDDDE
jgi:proliferating cell nuclear antigen